MPDRLGHTFGVAVLPFTDVRNRLSELVDEVAGTHERVEITRHGHPVAVLISAEDLAALEETLDVLSSPDAMRQLAESRAAVESGDLLDSDELEQALADLTSDGRDWSQVIREAIRAALRAQRGEQLRAEAEAVAADPDDRAEARAVQADLDSLRAW